MSDSHPQGGNLFDMAKEGTKGLRPFDLSILILS